MLKDNCKRMALLILTSLLLFTGCMVGYGYNIKYIKATQIENTERFKIDEFNKIYLYVNMLKNQAQEDIDAISDKIEYDIMKAYPDLSVLKSELENKDYSNIYPILVSNSKDKFFGGIENGNNDVFISTLYNIITDFSYNSSTFSDSTEFRTWEDMIESQYNKELAKHSIKEIINKSRDLILLERISNTNSKHIKIDEPTYENLLEVYLTEGLEGLRNYTVLVPAYITETGDIFGTEDFYAGNRIKNYKFIVIQEFSIYDQIKAHYPELFNDNNIIEKLNDDAKIMNNVYGLGVAFIISYITSIIVMMSIFNNYILPSKKEDDYNT